MCLRSVAIRAMVLLVLAAVPSLASAKPQLRTTDPKWKLYQDIYHAAEINMELGRWEDALVRLDALLSKRVDTASVRYYRALCLANLKRWAESYDDFTRAFTMGDPASADDVAIAKECYEKMSEVKRRLGWVEVSVGPSREGDHPRLLIDGVPVQTDKAINSPPNVLSWAPIVVLRGEHVVEVQAQGREPLRQRVVVESKGDGPVRPLEFLTPLVMVKLWWEEAARPTAAAAVDGPSSAHGAAPSSPSQRSSVPSSYLGGAGLALGVTSVGLVGAHFLDRSDSDGLLVAGLVTGGAAVVSGVAALLLGGQPSDSRAAARLGSPRPPQGTLGHSSGRLLVSPAPQGGTMIWAGTF